LPTPAGRSGEGVFDLDAVGAAARRAGSLACRTRSPLPTTTSLSSSSSYGAKIPDCMGFAVYRIDSNGVETQLPSMAVFPGFTPKKGQTTERFPIQKFYWKDPYARLVADQTNSRRFRYKVVPLAGQPGSLKPMTVAFLTRTRSKSVRSWRRSGAPSSIAV